MAFNAAARAGWLIAEDNEDPKRRLMLSVKNNLAEEIDGLAYSIVDGALARESGSVSMSADDALGEFDRSSRRSECEEAVCWLRELLSDGPISQNEIMQLAEDNGHCWATVRRAKNRAGVVAHKEGFGKGGRWKVEVGNCHARTT